MGKTFIVLQNLGSILRFVKRRGARVVKPLIPSIEDLNNGYKSGNIVARYFRYFIDHKSSKKILHSGMGLIAIGTSFIPQTSLSTEEVPTAKIVVQAETTLRTQKSVQAPLSQVKINQSYSFFHPAIDFGSSIGQPVLPVKHGYVVFAGYTKDGYGNNVVIDHGQGLQSLYAHLSTITVSAGQEVNMNTIIGSVGRSGRTTGPHLHVEVRDDGRNINPLSIIPR